MPHTPTPTLPSDRVAVPAAKMPARPRADSVHVYPRDTRYPQAGSHQPQSDAMPWRVRDWLLIASDDQRRVSVRHILRIVCRHFGFTAAQVASLQRQPNITLARHVWWYLATRLSGQSLPQIGRAAGDRDHTSIMHARDKIAARRAIDAGFDAALTALEIAIKSQPEWA